MYSGVGNHTFLAKEWLLHFLGPPKSYIYDGETETAIIEHSISARAIIAEREARQLIVLPRLQI